MTLFTLTGEVYPYYYRMRQFRTVVTLLDVMLNVHIYNPQPFCLVSLKVFLVERGACILNFTTFHDLQCHFTTSHQNMSLYQVMPLHLTKSVKEHIAASVGNLNIFRIQQLKALLEESTTSESDSEKSSKSSGDEDRKKRHKKSKVKHKRKESKKHRRKHRKLSKHNDGDRRKDDSREKKDKR